MRKHISENVSKRNQRFYSITQKAYYIGLFGHSAAAFSFYFAGIVPMAIFNAFLSIPAFAFALILNRKGYHNLAFAFAFFELYFHQVIGAYYFGWEAGWQYWFIYLAGLGFFNPHWKSKFHVFLLLLLSGTLIFIFINFRHGQIPFSSEALGIAALLNSLLIVVILALLINYYARVVLKAEETLEHKNGELSEMNEEVKTQNNALAEKNEEIVSQNEQIVKSINYAERIQKAIMPDVDLLSTHLPDNFILFEPKDIVSGDFYWFSEVDGKILIACADCTGHGVPGGFMSMLGISQLNEIVSHSKIVSPSKILEHMRNKVKESLGQKRQGNVQKDGMDMSVCLVDRQQNTMIFSGANNGIFIIRNQKLIDYKPTKNPIGTYTKEIPFTEETIPLQKNDLVYLYTDGYLDQFGGTNGRKFMRKQLKNTLLDVALLPMNKQKEELQKRFNFWRGNFEQTDDCSLIGFRF